LCFFCCCLFLCVLLFFFLEQPGEGSEGGGVGCESGSGKGWVEVWEHVGEIGGTDRCSVGEGDAARRGLIRLAESQIESTQLTHHHLQRDVHYVVSYSASVGVSGVISGDDSQCVLIFGLDSRGRGVQTKVVAERSTLLFVDDVEPGEADKVNLHKIETREIGRGEGLELGLSIRFSVSVHSIQEEDVEDLGESRILDVESELDVVDRLAAGVDVLVQQSDHQLVDERVTQSGGLQSGDVGVPEITKATSGLSVVDEFAGGGPDADSAIVAPVARAGKLEGNRGDRVLSERVVVGGLLDGSGESGDGDEVDQIEDLTEIDVEGLRSLTYEHSALGRGTLGALGDVDVVDELLRVLFVAVGEGLGAGVIERLHEVAVGGARMGDSRLVVAVTIAGDVGD